MKAETVVRSRNCVQSKIFTRTFLRGEARQSEGADAHHEGANDHFRRSISVDTLILRQDERGGAANEGTMVPFAMRCRTRESKHENT